MREKIFDPILAVIARKLRQGIDQILSKRDCRIHILLSGALGECQYVHEYIANVQLDDRVTILDSSDE